MKKKRLQPRYNYMDKFETSVRPKITPFASFKAIIILSKRASRDTGKHFEGFRSIRLYRRNIVAKSYTE